MKNTIEIDKQIIQDGFICKMNEPLRGGFDIYLVLCAYSDDNRRVTISLKQLSLKSGYSVSQISRILRHLEGGKIIKRVNPALRGRKKTYQLLV